MIATTNTEHYENIAEAIRTKGVAGTFKPSEMAEAILSIISGSSDIQVLTGTFTPTSSDYASGKHIDVAIPSGKSVRAVIVAEATSDTSTIDRYAPDMVVSWLRRSSNIQAETLCRYKSSASTATLAVSVSTNTYPLASANSNTNATSYYYCINWYGGVVRFKTYGNYRFRANKTYEYIIVLK